MQTVTDKLKPLGLKKSGNKRTLPCHEWLRICVYADKNELHAALDRCIQDFIRPFLDTELAELGRRTSLQSACACDRARCERCWLEKNQWELRDANARTDSSGT